jgi:transcriptional regulator with XRE-family HTH domain
MPKTFAEKLRSLRGKAKLSQSALATAAGVQLRTLQELEQGRKPDPRISTVSKLAKALGVSLDKFA